MLTIDSKEIPSPSLLEVACEQSLFSVCRTLDGTAHPTGAGLRRTVTCVWPYLTPQQTQTLFQAVSPDTFEMTFPDPVSGEPHTARFYCAARQAGLYRDGCYTDIRLTLKEV